MNYFKLLLFGLPRKLLYYAYKLNPKTGIPEKVKLMNNRYLLLDKDDKGLSYELAVNDGKREEVATKMLMGLSGHTFLDIGANLGYYTLLLADNFERVVAVEPIPHNAYLLKKSLNLNGLTNVEVVEKAVAYKSGKVRMKVMKAKNWSRVSDTGDIEVDGISFDELLEKYRPDLVKMDIEGYEYELLTKSALYRAPKHLFVELHFGFLPVQKIEEILQTLDNIGYRIAFVAYEFKYHFRNRWFDSIFISLTKRTVQAKGYRVPIVLRNIPIGELRKHDIILQGGLGCLEVLFNKR